MKRKTGNFTFTNSLPQRVVSVDEIAIAFGVPCVLALKDESTQRQWRESLGDHWRRLQCFVCKFHWNNGALLIHLSGWYSRLGRYWRFCGSKSKVCTIRCMDYFHSTERLFTKSNVNFINRIKSIFSTLNLIFINY